MSTNSIALELMQSAYPHFNRRLELESLFPHFNRHDTYTALCHVCGDRYSSNRSDKKVCSASCRQRLARQAKSLDKKAQKVHDLIHDIAQLESVVGFDAVHTALCGIRYTITKTLPQPHEITWFCSCGTESLTHHPDHLTGCYKCGEYGQWEVRRKE